MPIDPGLFASLAALVSAPSVCPQGPRAEPRRDSCVEPDRRLSQLELAAWPFIALLLGSFLFGWFADYLLLKYR